MILRFRTILAMSLGLLGPGLVTHADAVAADADTAPAAKKKQPNIVFIFSDDHAYQAISAYQESRKLLETPNIDRIAKEGVLFNRCLVPNSICGPSRATVLTGKYSHINGFPNNSNSRFDGTQQTFPKHLQKAGYSTAIIGKWHLESDPTGFDHWQILPGQGVYYNPPMIRNGKNVEEEGYVTDIITDRSLEWLDKRDKDKPFLLMMQHKAPHREWAPALRHLNHDKDRQYSEPETLFDDYANRGLAVKDQDMTIEKTFTDRDAKFVPPPRLTPEQKAAWDAYYEPRNEAFRKANPQGKDLVRWRYQRYMHDYLGTIKSVDESVGRVLKYLDDAGLAENTIIVYASDQGFFLGEHGWFDKRWILEESVRTPLLVRWPGHTQAGTVNNNLVSVVDFAQTFLQAAGAEPIDGAQGASLVPVLEGKTPDDWRKSFYYHYYEFPRPHQVRPHYGVVTDQYKLVHFYGPDVNYWELYDRKNDPHELQSFYDKPEYREIQTDLKKELDRLRKELKVPDPDPPGFSGGGGKGKGARRKALEQPVLKIEAGSATTAQTQAEDASGKGNHGKLNGVTLSAGRDDKQAFVFDGKGHIQIANSDSLDPSGGAWSIQATVKAEAGQGVILARGGEALGYALYVDKDGKPSFSVNNGERTTLIQGKDSILSQWVTLNAVISKEKKLLLYVDGNEVAASPQATEYIERDPSDSLQIGADTGSPVIDSSVAGGFKGLIESVELFSGEKRPAVQKKNKAVSSSNKALPNVVVIFTDDLGYGDLACYGSKQNKTPHLDQMAKEGVKFDRFYVAQPVCSASRAALLTGCYPSRIGIQGALGPGAKTGLSYGEMTIAELVKQKGYATAAVGKWHLGDHPKLLPTNHGFDSYYGLPYSNDMWPYHPENAKRKVSFPALPLIEGTQVINAEVSPEDQTHLTTSYTEKAVHFINQNKEKPFFLYLAHSMPHVPLYVSDKFKDKSPHGIYADVIEEIDWSVGEVLKALKDSGVDDNTLVIFTSDNGPWLNYGTHSGVAGELREGKGTVWEGGVRMPFIARWPGKIPAGSEVKEPAMTIDVLPTIAGIIDASLPNHRIDGRDVLPLLTAKAGAKNPHEAYYFYYKQNELHAVMSGDWKLYLPHAYRTMKGEGRSDGLPVQYGQQKLEAPELYNVATDIGEKQNVASANLEVVAHLLMLAESAREDLGDSLHERHGTGTRDAANTDSL